MRKRRKAPTSARARPRPSPARRLRRPRRASDPGKVKLARLERELAEALEQQAATSEVLRVISSSPGELEPVFQTMLANAVRLCEAKFGTMFRFMVGLFLLAGEKRNAPQVFLNFKTAWAISSAGWGWPD